MEGIYEFGRKFESVIKHLQFIVTKVVGLTKISSKKRKAGLIKSIVGGGLGIEIHDHKDLDLEIGEKTVVDS